MTEKRVKKEKSRWVAILLLVMFGAFGTHNFYLGQRKAAVTQLCMAVADVISFAMAFGVAFVLALSNKMTAGASMVVMLFVSLVLGLTFTLFVWLVTDFIRIIFSQKKWLVWKKINE